MMNGDELESKLKAIFSSVLEVPAASINDEFSSETCEKWDSLSHIQLIGAIEQEFGIELEIDEQLRMLSFAFAKEVVRTATSG
jgi:acyl carrier protein